MWASQADSLIIFSHVILAELSAPQQRNILFLKLKLKFTR
jgi:hypothetical protein